MDFCDYLEHDMVQFDQDNSTQCAVHDLTPGSEQKKINIVVRPSYTVGKVFSDITTQYRYDNFDLVLQPPKPDAEVIYLNHFKQALIYEMEGFDRAIKNTLVILPPGSWDGNVKRRFDLAMPTPKSIAGHHPYHHLYLNNNNNNNVSMANNNNDTHVSMSNAGSLTTAAACSSAIAGASSTSTSSGACGPNSGSTPYMASIANLINPDSLHLSPMSDPEPLSDDDLALGASASPIDIEGPNGEPLSLAQTSPNSSHVKFGPETEEFYQQVLTTKVGADRSERNYLPVMKKNYVAPELPSTSMRCTGNGFVGLVNQAMTCYLNSLLQALYMTPEFRNALYRWEFDNDNESKNIPYQLQKLFLNLQTSKKNAVETTDLTRSFGWDSSEAWQQHDIQELCRVMFDALEHKFRNTKQANLIANLYEGKMLDYVKCLECNTEKSRTDTFLDIPVPIRPYGNTVAYGSIEEALRAFVQPETLDGNNQYFCEKCNKKCDAHKGLKFKNFPYILTLHLKRFDFDYQTLNRIKLNDKVTFPQKLNLNSFISAADAPLLDNMQSNETNGVSGAAHINMNGASTSAGATNGFNGGNSKYYLLNGLGGTGNTDDSSTTDSGSAMEEDNYSSGIPTTSASSQNENEMNDEDEGIDLSTSTDHRASTDERMQQNVGPYVYELFAIMIHSGSASGGHYYAYIKESENDEWFCFNDTSVTPITNDDIQKTFGGNTNRAYYSTVYTSSTNAYMLMYRQVDPARNERPMKEDEFPEHIKSMMPSLKQEGEMRGSRATRHATVSELALPELIKPRVYFYNPTLKKLKVTRVYISHAFDVNFVLESAYQMLNVNQFAPLNRCRLVGYDQSSEEIIQSFERCKDPTLADIRSSCDGTLDFLLEYRAEGQELEIYEPGGTTWYVFSVNVAKQEIDGPYFVHSPAHEYNDVLRHSIAVRMHVKETQLLIATIPGKKAFVAYDPAPTKEAQEHLQMLARTQFRNLTYLYLNVPKTDSNVLDMLNIPAYETQTPAIEVSCDVVDAMLMNGATTNMSGAGDATANGTNNACLSTSNDYSQRDSRHESNSEDSSLSDGDRTLVESIQNRGGNDSQISSSSHSPQLSSPEDESAHESYNRIDAYFNSANNHHAEPDSGSSTSQFFHAIKIDAVDTTGTTYSTNNATYNTNSSYQHSASDAAEDAARKPAYCYKIIVDSRMKMNQFQRYIESLIRVPCNYFKIQRKLDSVNMSESLICLTEGETLHVELGRVLQNDEHKAKIFFMRLSEVDNDTSKLMSVCEWIYGSSTTVAEAKRELIIKLQRLDPVKYEKLHFDNCRLWVKYGRNPIKILSDEDTLISDVRSAIAAEYLLQECENGISPQTPPDSITIFIRKWHPDTLQLDGFQEITLEQDTEIRNLLAKNSDIPEENIAYSKINGSFPCTNISLLSLNSSLTWFPTPATVDKYPLTTTVTGNVYFYKDNTKMPKELSGDERREWNTKEKARLDRLGGSSSSIYSPRRERALKIYLDSPQANPTKAAPPVEAAGYAKNENYEL